MLQCAQVRVVIRPFAHIGWRLRVIQTGRMRVLLYGRNPPWAPRRFGARAVKDYGRQTREHAVVPRSSGSVGAPAGSMGHREVLQWSAELHVIGEEDYGQAGSSPYLAL
jgi:hypothetical protein